MERTTRGQDRSLSPEETAQRVAVLKRLRELLTRQRDKFRNYLEVLDSQHETIQRGDAESLITQVDFEESIVADIAAVQKTVSPLEIMCQSYQSETESDIPKLKDALEELKTEAQARSRRNRTLLNERMNDIRQEIRTLKTNPFARRRSVYADPSPAAIIDLKG